MCNQSTCIEPTTTLKFTKVVLSVLLAVHRGLRRIFHPLQHCAVVSFLEISTPAFLTVPLFHVSRFQSIRWKRRQSVTLQLCTVGLRSTEGTEGCEDRATSWEGKGTRNSSGDETANVNSFTATSSTTFMQCAPEATEFGEITQNKSHYVVQGHWRSPTDFGTKWKLIYDFLLVINTNLPPILHHFRDIAFDRSKIALLG